MCHRFYDHRNVSSSITFCIRMDLSFFNTLEKFTTFHTRIQRHLIASNRKNGLLPFHNDQYTPIASTPIFLKHIGLDLTREEQLHVHKHLALEQWKESFHMLFYARSLLVENYQNQWEPMKIAKKILCWEIERNVDHTFRAQFCFVWRCWHLRIPPLIPSPSTSLETSYSSVTALVRVGNGNRVVASGLNKTWSKFNWSRWEFTYIFLVVAFFVAIIVCTKSLRKSERKKWIKLHRSAD